MIAIALTLQYGNLMQMQALTHTIAQATQTIKRLTVSNKKTSEALQAYMKRLKLEPTGDYKVDMETIKQSGKVPRWKK